MNKKNSDIRIHTYQKILIILIIILMILFTFIDFNILNNTLSQTMVKNSILRFLGGIILIIILIGFHQKQILRFKNVGKSFLIMIPALIISINNFPIVAFLDGRATLREPVYQVYLFLIECLSVGFFEEIVFRGIILMLLLKKLEHHKNGVLLSILFSSAIFGLSHIINFYSGLSFGDTMLQIGYSFLVGMLWAVMFLKTGNLWLTMILHATFNFFGQVMFLLGDVNGRYDIYTILITIFFGVVVALYSFKLYNQFKDQELINFD